MDSSAQAVWTVQYHRIRGLAAPLRMMLEYSGTPYENRYAESWFSSEKATVQQRNALANLPTVFDTNGEVVTLSCAAFWYVGETLGLNGDNAAERTRVDQVVCQVQDWRNTAVKTFYSKRRKDTYEKHLAQVASNYEKLEAVFKRGGFVYSAANHLTTGDFHLFEMIDQHEEFARAFGQPSIIAAYPFLRDFYVRFYSLPQLQKYFRGPLHKLPINNPNYASFYGGPDLFELGPCEEDDEGEGGGEDEADDGTIEVGYWKIRGLAAPLRMMCSFAGAKFKSVEYPCTGSGSTGFDRSSWSTKAKPALKEVNPLMNLPYVKSGRDLVTQSNACVLYLGRKFGLLGSSPKETARIKQVMWQTTDMRNQAVGEFYGSAMTPEAVAVYSGKVKTHYDKLEAWMKQQGTAFSAGDSVAASDFHLFEMLDQHEEYARSTKIGTFLADRPCLAAFYKRFRELPQLQEYFAGRLHKLPVNNAMASFGAHEDYSSHHHFKKL